MKKHYLYLGLFLVFGMLFTMSCSKDDSSDEGGDNPDNLPEKTRITEFNDLQALDTTFHAFAYNERKLMYKEVFRDKNKVVFKILKYEYNTSDKPVRTIEYQDEDMNIAVASTMYTLDGSGNVIKAVEDRSGNITTIDYTYNSGRLAEADISYSGASNGPPMQMKFYWNGDNVSKIEYYVDSTGNGFVLTKYEEMEFDSKTNPFFDIKLPSLDPVQISANNVTKIKEYDSNGVFQHLTSFQYSKYTGDLPASAYYDYGYRQGIYEYKYKDI